MRFGKMPTVLQAPAEVSSDAAADFYGYHILERREQLRPLLKAAVDADALKWAWRRRAACELSERIWGRLGSLSCLFPFFG